MNPNDNRLEQLEKQVALLQSVIDGLVSQDQLSPQVQRTIKTTVDTIMKNNLATYLETYAVLGNLGDVDTTGQSSGQVLKYNGSYWYPGTDNVAA